MKRITIIPLSTPRTISDAAVSLLVSSKLLYVQTLKHCTTDIVTRMRPDAVSMDELYDTCADFDELNARIAERLVSSDSCAYAVPGRGLNSTLMKELQKAAMDKGFTIETLPAQGFAEAAIAVAINAGFDADMCEYRIQAASSVKVSDTDSQLVIEELDSLLSAGEVKLELSELYPDEHMVCLCTMDEQGRYNTETLPLYKLDSVDNASKFNIASVLIVPKCTLMQRSRHGLDGLMEVMHRLRAPGGCPWDMEQTHESLRSSLIEESYEVLDAIDKNDMTALEEELGDLLLQVVFHSIIEDEKRNFNMVDVISGIVNKLIYRHPHVFGDVEVNSSDDVLVNWEKLKKKEKHQNTVADAMLAVPAAFPALMRSYKIQKKVANVGFDFDNAQTALPKVHEEAEEVLAAIVTGDAENLNEEIGDLLFACVNVARLSKVDPELALLNATNKFMARFISIEKLILSDGKHFENMSLPEMDEYWDKVKINERKNEI